MKNPLAVYLASAPVIATAIAYLFEAGFASFHGIPTSLIQLSISQMVGTGVLGLLGLWVLHTYFALGVAFLARRKHLLFKFVGLGMLYVAIPLMLIVGLGVVDTKAWIGVAIIFLMPTVIGLVEALTTKDKTKSFTQCWWDKASSSVGSTPSKSDGLDSIIDTPQIFFSAVMLVIIFSFSLGHRYAALVTPKFLLKSDPSKVLIVVYGDKWFFRPVGEAGKAKGSAPGELYILSGDSLKEVVLFDQQSPLLGGG